MIFQIDEETRSKNDFVLIPLNDVDAIVISHDLSYDSVRLKKAEGIMFLNSKKFVVNGKSLDKCIKEAEK